MKIILNNCLAIFFLVIFVSHLAHAKDPTCAGKLERDLFKAGLACTLIPGFGWYFGLLLAPDFIMAKKKINLLRAATSVVTEEMANFKTQERITKFYRRLVKYYPYTELSREEVASVIHQFNTNSYQMGLCSNTGSLMSYLFPDGKISGYIEEQQKFFDSQIIRNAKNSGEGVRYYHDDL